MNSWLSIHKAPKSIGFAPITHTLAVTVELFQFSSRPGVMLMDSVNLDLGLSGAPAALEESGI
jgi:hypothetical protein